MLLVDTGVFLPAADRDEPSHGPCSDLLRAHRDHIVTTGPVVAETAWMIESRLGPAAESVFVSAIAAGNITVTDLTRVLYERCVELIDAYIDLGLGLVDASLIAAAEHHNQPPSLPSTTETSPSSDPLTPTPSTSSPDPTEGCRPDSKSRVLGLLKLVDALVSNPSKDAHASIIGTWSRVNDDMVSDQVATSKVHVTALGDR